jgi:hypothetical protein
MRRCSSLGIALVLIGSASLAGPSGAETLRWGRLGVVGATPADSSAWIGAFDLEGRPVEPGSLEDGIRRGLHALARMGYPFAEARPGSFAVEGDLVIGSIELNPGPRAHLEDLELPGPMSPNRERPGEWRSRPGPPARRTRIAGQLRSVSSPGR